MVEKTIFNPLLPDTTFTPVPQISQAIPVPHPQLNLPTSRNPLRHGGWGRRDPKARRESEGRQKGGKGGGEDPGARETKGEREKASHRGVSSMET